MKQKKTKVLYRRTRYLISTRFQLRYVGIILLMIFFTAAVCSYTVYYTGMIALVEKDFAASANYYEQARKAEPKNTQALLGYARANHELENYGSVRLAYDELRKADPGLAAQLAYLDLRGDEAARAADISQAKEVTLWAEK
jgi:hypothetical protein